MLYENDDVTARMQQQISTWEQTGDPRALFLRCYLLMTENMFNAITRGEFHDPQWVAGLLQHFASYYFVALDTYEYDPGEAPAIWQRAFELTADPGSLGLQRLLLGVNAHINYDLVLALTDALGQEWASLTADQRTRRYADHCHVNEVIGQTVDSVQDQILEEDQPWMRVADTALGPLDEFLISMLITHWRERVWNAAIELIETGGDDEGRWEVIRLVENKALQIADTLGSARWGSLMKELM